MLLLSLLTLQEIRLTLFFQLSNGVRLKTVKKLLIFNPRVLGKVKRFQGAKNKVSGITSKNLLTIPTRTWQTKGGFYRISSESFYSLNRCCYLEYKYHCKTRWWNSYSKHHPLHLKKEHNVVCSDAEANVRLRAEIPEDVYMVHDCLSKEIENEDEGTVQIGLFIQELLPECLWHPRTVVAGEDTPRLGSFSCSERGVSADATGFGNTEYLRFSSKSLQGEPKRGFC